MGIIITRYDYVPGTKYSASLGSKIIKRSQDFSGRWSKMAGEFTYYFNDKSEALYREHRAPQTNKLDYAEEYRVGTVRDQAEMPAGNLLHITINAAGLVTQRVMYDNTSGAWQEVETYYDLLPWKYGTSYGRYVDFRYYVNADKTINFAYGYKKGDHTNPIMRYDYEDGTIYGDNHGAKIKYMTNTNTNIIHGGFRYHMDATGELRYREHINPQTQKFDYAEEYFPGRVFKRDDMEKGKSIRIWINAAGLVTQRVKLDKATGQWKEVESYHTLLPWKYGTSYENEIQFRFYVQGDKTIKYAYGYKKGDNKNPIMRYEYQPGTKYGENHGAKITRRTNTNWSVDIGNFRYHMKLTGEIRYRERINAQTKKVDYAEEYFPGTVYKRDSLDKGKSMYVHINAQGKVTRRIKLDKASQWHIVEEYHDLIPWKYGTGYELHIKFRFYVQPDKTIKYAHGFEKGNHTTPITLYGYQPGTKYGENHGAKIISAKDLRPVVQTWVWPTAARTLTTYYLPHGAPCKSGNAPECYPNINGGAHYGVDIGARYGDTVYAVSSGTIVVARYDNAKGNHIIIHHGDGIYSNYYHLSEFRRTGGTVSVGEPIGQVGATGMAFGAHLHFQMGKGGYGNGNSIDPGLYIPGLARSKYA
jgi:hypothetical protein